MTVLSNADRAFLERRRARKHVGLYVLPVLFLTGLCAWIGLYMYWPQAVNPMRAAVYFEGMPIEKGTVTEYSVMVSILTNLVFVLLGAVCALGIAFGATERRYRKLVEALLARGTARPEATAQAPALPAEKPTGPRV